MHACKSKCEQIHVSNITICLLLGGHRWAQRAKLSGDVVEKLPCMVAATIDVYNTIRAELLPTPTKSHYLYNMRDLSKMFQVCLTKPCMPH